MVLGQCLGRGSFASVYEVKKLQLNCDRPELDCLMQIERSGMARRLADQKKKKKKSQFVIKRIISQRAQQGDSYNCAVQDIVHEAQVLLALNHPHILSVKGLSLNGVSAFSSGRASDYFILFERLDQTLEGKIYEQWRGKLAFYRKCHRLLPFSSRRQQFDSKILQFQQYRISTAADIASAVSYMHELSVIHRDIKASNVGFTSVGEIKLFDLGLAKILPPSRKNASETYLLSRVGTPIYRAPEVTRGDFYGKAADVYSLGVLIWEIMALSTPFEWRINFAYSDSFTVEKVPVCPCWPQPVQDLVRDCVAVEPKHRPATKHISAALHGVIYQDGPLSSKNV